MTARKAVRTITNAQGECLYCLDDVCEDLGLQTVTIPLTDKGEAVYEAPSADGKRTYTFVTLVALNKVLDEAGTPEAKAMQYRITRGVYACPTRTGKMLFNAKDVARCLGYTNPNGAIKRYCKSVSGGLIDASDAYRLVAHSKLSTAESFRAWIADRVSEANVVVLRGNPVCWW